MEHLLHISGFQLKVFHMFSTKAGTTNANINKSNYLSNIDAVNVDVEDEGDDIDIDVIAVLAL